MSKDARPSQRPQGAAPKKGDSPKHTPRIANRRALYDYHVLERVEAGLELVGSEVKSVRAGRVQLAQAFARIRNGEAFLFGCHIDEYEEAHALNHDPIRVRRLLLHRREIRKLTQRLQKETGSTLIPLEIYFKRGYAKVQLALAKGKAKYDKRASIKEREDKRNMAQALRRR